MYVQNDDWHCIVVLRSFIMLNLRMDMNKLWLRISVGRSARCAISRKKYDAANSMLLDLKSSLWHSVIMLTMHSQSCLCIYGFMAHINVLLLFITFVMRRNTRLEFSAALQNYFETSLTRYEHATICDQTTVLAKTHISLENTLRDWNQVFYLK